MNTSDKNKDTVRKSLLNDKTIQSLRELGEILRDIHTRLISEGYIIKNGIITGPNEQSEIDHCG